MHFSFTNINQIITYDIANKLLKQCLENFIRNKPKNKTNFIAKNELNKIVSFILKLSWLEVDINPLCVITVQRHKILRVPVIR